MTALIVVGLPAVLAWRIGLRVAIVALALGAWGVSAQASRWQRQHRAEVHARPPVDFRALDRAGQAQARADAGAITGLAKVVGWLPAAAPGLGLLLVLTIGWRRRRHQGSGSTTSLDASR